MKTKNEIKEELEKANQYLSKPLSPHSMRHTEGTIEALKWVLDESNSVKESAIAGDAFSFAAKRLKAIVKELQEVVNKLERP